MKRTSSKALSNKYGRTAAMFIHHIHTLYTSGECCVSLMKIDGLPDGRYVYPYPHFIVEEGYTSVYCSNILKLLRDKGLAVRVRIGKTPLYKLNYSHPEIVDAGYFEDTLSDSL